MSKTRYVLDYSLTVLKEDNFGICHSSTNLAKSVCEISKEEAAHFVKFCVDNDLHELKKTKVSIKNEER